MSTLHVFTAYGIELEYMIVDQRTLAVQPIAERLLDALDNTSALGAVACSYELAQHVIEVKNPYPAQDLASLVEHFQSSVREVNRILATLGAQLMPSGMHPSMDPRTETHIWSRQQADVFAAYDRLFDCHRHAWANVQSMQLNLPFSGDVEFTRLHTAIRLLLPILPALAASSPIAMNATQGMLDFRLQNYREQSARVPAINGALIPEPSAGREQYRVQVLEAIYRELEPYDPAGILRQEWVNQRGVIPRFDRDALEIRLIDMQECPQADLAIAAATTAAVRALYDQRWSSREAQDQIGGAELALILSNCIRDGEAAEIENGAYLARMGLAVGHCRAGELWRHLIDATRVAAIEPLWSMPLSVILQEGPLARRILRALGTRFDARRLQGVYQELCDCLALGHMFTARP